MVHARLIACAALAGALAGGCRDDARSGEREDPGQARAAEAAGRASAAAGGAVRFSVEEREGGRLWGVMPQGWVAVGTSAFKPPDEAGLGHGTTYTVWTSCAGVCEAKEWAGEVERAEARRYVRRDTDEPLEDPAGRLLVGLADGRTTVTVARWRPGGARYAVCRATLAEPADGLRGAFVEACLGMGVGDLR